MFYWRMLENVLGLNQLRRLEADEEESKAKERKMA
jgi:hypothetical protein